MSSDADSFSPMVSEFWKLCVGRGNSRIISDVVFSPLTAVLACAESYLILGIAFVAPPIKFTLKFRHREYLSPIFHLFSCYLPSIGKNE